MTTFAPDATPRYKAGYISAGLTHSMQVRLPRTYNITTGPSYGQSLCNALTVALEALLPVDFHFTSAAWCEQDSNVFTPVAAIPADPIGVQVVADYSANLRACETIFQGSGGGHRVTMNVFGVFWDLGDPTGPAANGRVETTENSHILAAVGVLNGSTNQVSIANLAAKFNPYANIKINDYWLHRVRKLYP